MDMKELAAPMVLNLIQSVNSPADLAQELSGFIEEESILKTRRNFEALKSLMSCYQCALLEVETKFKVLNERFSLNHERNPIEMIKTRMKSPESIREKLSRRNLPFSLDSLDQIHDIAGIRVICSFVDDIKDTSDLLLGIQNIYRKTESAQ